jgi:hypothetical protein
MPASAWVSEIIAAEQQSRKNIKATSRVFAAAMLCCIAAMVTGSLAFIVKKPALSTITVPVAVVTGGAFVTFLTIGIVKLLGVKRLQKHAASLHEQHGPLTTQNTTLTQLQPYLAGWTIAGDNPDTLHLLHTRTPGAARVLKWLQLLGGLALLAAFSLIIWHNGWSLSGIATGARAIKLKFIIYLMPLVGAGLILFAIVPSAVQVVIDRAKREVLVEEATLLGVNARIDMLKTGIAEFKINASEVVASDLKGSQVFSLAFTEFDNTTTPKPLRPVMANIVQVRQELLRESLERASGLPATIA